MFYTTFEGATDFNQIGDAPFGNYSGQFGSTFAAPFTNRASGNSIPNLFPAPPPVKGFSQQHPASGPPYDTLAEFFSAFGTIGSSPAMYPKNQVPYAENYEFSIERQLTPSDLADRELCGHARAQIVGFSYRRTRVIQRSACRLLHKAADPVEKTTSILRPDGSFVLGTRGPFGGVTLPAGQTIGAPACVVGSNPNSGCVLPAGQTGIVPFGNDSYFVTAAYSAYNSLQINWRHTSTRAQLLLGYTFSKSLDNSSGYGEQFNPINPRISRGLSAFDSHAQFRSELLLQSSLRQARRTEEINEWLADQRHHAICYRSASDHC